MPLKLQYNPDSKLLTVIRTCETTGRIIDILESNPEIVHVHSLGHKCPCCAKVSRFSDDAESLGLLKYSLYLAMRSNLDESFTMEAIAEDHRAWIQALNMEIEFEIEDMQFEISRTIAMGAFDSNSFKIADRPSFFREFVPLEPILKPIAKVSQG